MIPVWFVNVGRPPIEGEAKEFAYQFKDADPELLRRSIDDYFAQNPPFPKLPGLRAVYERVLDDAKASAPKLAEAPPVNLLSAEQRAVMVHDLRVSIFGVLAVASVDARVEREEKAKADGFKAGCASIHAPPPKDFETRRRESLQAITDRRSASAGGTT